MEHIHVMVIKETNNSILIKYKVGMLFDCNNSSKVGVDQVNSNRGTYEGDVINGGKV